MQYAVKRVLKTTSGKIGQREKRVVETLTLAVGTFFGNGGKEIKFSEGLK